MRITDRVNELTELSEDEREFLTTRTSGTFCKQFVFYYEMSGCTGSLFQGKPIVRAIEETLNIHWEESQLLHESLNDILDSDSLDMKAKLDKIKEIVNT